MPFGRTHEFESRIQGQYCRPGQDRPGSGPEWLAELEAGGEPARAALLRLGAARGSVQLRTCVFTYLVQLKEPRAVGMFAAVANDLHSSQPVRDLAVQELRLLEGQFDVQTLSVMLLAKGDETALFAVRALGHSPELIAVDALKWAAGDPRLAPMMVEIVRALGNHRSFGLLALEEVLKEAIARKSDEILAELASTFIDLERDESRMDALVAIEHMSDGTRRRTSAQQMRESLNEQATRAVSDTSRENIRSTLERLNQLQ